MWCGRSAGCPYGSTGEVTPRVSGNKCVPTSLLMGHGHREPLHPRVLDGTTRSERDKSPLSTEEKSPESQSLPGLAAFYCRFHVLIKTNTKLSSSL